MKLFEYMHNKGQIIRIGLLGLSAVLFLIGLGSGAQAKHRPQRYYPSPEAAVQAMAEAVKSGDTASLIHIFGPGSKAIVLSGDPVEDKLGRDRFVKIYEEKNRLEEGAGKVLLYVGNEDWPFPIPLIKTDKGWLFDTKAGRKEILARRIGRNELNAIQVCLAYVDAQKEFAQRKAGMEKGLPEYAREFVSAPGKRDGLYWEVGEGEEQSPMGPLFAAAQAKGYGKKPLGGSPPKPYHGYLYRIIKAQGKNASGGPRDYIVDGKMIGGFALIASPAKYGASGVMTFMVNHKGSVVQKDLGKKTAEAAGAITIFDPDETWKPVQK